MLEQTKCLTWTGDYTSSRAAFLGHFAEKDDWVSDAALKKLRRSIETAGRAAEFFVYPDTRHWFFEPDRADAYNSRAAELAWKRTLKFLREQAQIACGPPLATDRRCQ